MKLSYSKVITALPLLLGLLMIIGDYAFDFTVTQEQITLIEFLVGSTIVGGTFNAGFKRYTAYKEKIKDG